MMSGCHKYFNSCTSGLFNSVDDVGMLKWLALIKYVQNGLAKERITGELEKDITTATLAQAQGM